MTYAERPYAVAPYAVIDDFDVGGLPVVAIRAALTGNVIVTALVHGDVSADTPVLNDRRFHVGLKVS